MPYRFRPLSVLYAAASTVATLATCSSTPTPFYQQEQLDATASPYARTFHAKPDTTCEAARRALLSQGYVSSSPRADMIDGSKNFQLNDGSHVVISFRVVCAEANIGGTSGTVYVNVVQDHYTLKKTSVLTSVRLSILGSVSLPIGSGDDLMVKVASETVPAGVFHECYLNLVDHLLKINPARKDYKVAKAAEKEHVTPLPELVSMPQGEPIKMTTLVVPMPTASLVPVTAPASAPAPAPASAPASAPAAVSASKASAEVAPISAPAVTTPTAPAAAPSPAPTSELTSSTTGGAS